MTREQLKEEQRQELLEALQRRAKILGMDVTASSVSPGPEDYYYYVWKMPEPGSQAGADLLLSVQEKYAGPVIRLFFIMETKPKNEQSAIWEEA